MDYDLSWIDRNSCACNHRRKLSRASSWELHLLFYLIAIIFHILSVFTDKFLSQRINSAAMGTNNSGIHDAGALTLLKHRQEMRYTSDLSAKLALAAQTQAVSRVCSTMIPI